MKQSWGSKGAGDRAGFTLVEILVVVGIIMVLAAVSLPSIARYFRNYQIRAASQQVASEIQTARNKAIGRNVNFGVVFIITSPTQYRWVSEDLTGNVGAFSAGQRPPIINLLNDAPLVGQRGPTRTLPTGITFGAGVGPVNCVINAANFAANDSGFRFNRLGGWCDPDPAEPDTVGHCPALGTGAVLLSNNLGAAVCLVQLETGLTRTITVEPGGRVLAQP